MAGFREFNLVWFATACLALLLAERATVADEIRKWRDASGVTHYSVTGGPETDSSGQSGKAPVMRGRQASAAETFSVTASLKRREIENKLAAAGDDLTKTRDAIRDTQARNLVVYSPPAPQNPADTQLVLDAQRNAFLAARAFEHEQEDQLRRLRRHERQRLREILDLWKQFAALDSEVMGRYDVSPAWWRGRLDCGRCPTSAEAEEALKPREEPLAGE